MTTEATTSTDVMVHEVASILDEIECEEVLEAARETSLAASVLLEAATSGIPIVEDAANHLFRAAALAADAAGISVDEQIARFTAQANRLR